MGNNLQPAAQISPGDSEWSQKGMANNVRGQFGEEEITGMEN
jgi:hypothetical protein